MRINGCSMWLFTGLALGIAGGYYLGSAAAAKVVCTPLRCAMRKLWADHVIWTRLAIMSLLSDAPDTKPTVERLMKNQEDIGSAVVPFYGKEAGTKLTALLKAHIQAVADFIAAAKAHDKEKMAAQEKLMFANADEIAAFLSKANPNWPEQALRDLLYEHLNVTHKEIELRMQENWAADVAQFDVVFDQIMKLSDALTDGLLKQFPDKA